MRKTIELTETRQVSIGECEVVTCDGCGVEAPHWRPDVVPERRRANTLGWFAWVPLAEPGQAIWQGSVKEFCPACAADTVPPDPK